ncbi:PAS domain-containing sensor histidine kinase [Janibacter terrae]|uniref:PAS domain-containing sensor histidine kinase n=1 Tax=Janibacter terrae TaxID=103817 RepID=UPI0031F746A0
MDELIGGDADVAHLFHGVVGQSGAGIYLVQDGMMVYTNPSFAAFFGTTPDRFIGRSLADVAPRQQRESLVAQFERRIAGTEPDDHFVIRTDLPGLGDRTIELHGTRIEYRGRPAVVGVGLDVTDRVRAHADLVESRAQLRQLMVAIETIQDEERNRMSLELHDVIGGMLTALKFDIARMRKRIQREAGAVDEAGLVAMTEELSHRTQEAIDVVRRLSDELRPALLEHLGLVASVEDEVRRFASRFDIDAEVTVPDEGLALDGEVELAAFRIVQEALTNVARHAQANRVTVAIAREPDGLRITVQDNGTGIDRASVPEGRIGLIGMGERARRIGASVTVEPVAGGGTLVDLRVPHAP